MQFTAAFLATIFSATALTAPAPQTIVTPGKPVTWEISHFDPYMSGDGKSYTFDIESYNGQAGTSSFSTYCFGSTTQAGFVPCADSQIEATLVLLTIH